MVNDVARAFFEAPARRTICVELPEEETHKGDGGGQKGVDQGGVQKRQVQPPARATKRREASRRAAES